MSNVLVTGGSGQLARAVFNLQNSNNIFKFYFTSHKDLDITNLKACKDFIKTNNITYIINCAAFTQVDLAETQREQAYNTNTLGPEILAVLATKYNSKLIHISTDYVYSGDSNKPYIESDLTRPINYYGETKLLGEQNIIKNAANYIIIRTSWLYYHTGKNFVNTILNLLDSKTELNIVADQYGTPTNCYDLAKFILFLLDQDHHQSHNNIDANLFNNTYNFSNLGRTNWYEFTKAIFDIANRFLSTQKQLHCTINPIDTEQYPTPAKRPKYSVLDKNKVVNQLGYDIPQWLTSLENCLYKKLTLETDKELI